MAAVSSLPDDTISDVTGNVTSNSTEPATGASIVSPIVMFLAGLLGNVLALMVLHKTRTEIRSMMFYTLVAALTWNDLVGICLTSPPVLAAYLNERHMPALPFLCRFHALAMVCFGLSTPFIVCAMAIERSLALKCNYFYSKYCTPTSARVLVALLWGFVLLFGALPLFGVGALKLQYPETWCFLDFRATEALHMAYAYAFAIINLLVVAVMVVCNGLVMTTLCRVRSRRRMSNASVNSTLLDAVGENARHQPPLPPPPLPQNVRRRHHHDVELQMIWLLFAITTIFSVCWVPLMVYILFCLQSPDNQAPLFGLVAVRLASLNQTLNPWIYVILRKSLLLRISKLCQENFLCDEPQNPPRRAWRKPMTRHFRMQLRDPYAIGRPKNYVHVRQKLCPSNHFVGLQNEAVSLTEGQRQSGDSNSRSGSRSQGGSSNSSLCSVCRARIRMERMGEGGVVVGGKGRGARDSASSIITPKPPSSSSSFSTGGGGGSSKGQDCIQQASSQIDGRSNSLCNGSSTDQQNEHLRFVFWEGDNNQANNFCLPSSSSSSSSSCPHPPSSHDVTESPPAAASDIIVPYRRQSGRGRGGVTSAAAAAASINIPSYVSEADDHGYSSKVSTDSSRMSTPERPPHQSGRTSPGPEDHMNNDNNDADPEDHRPKDEDHLAKPLPSSRGGGEEDTPPGPPHAPQAREGVDHNHQHHSVGLTSGVFDSREDDVSSSSRDVVGGIRMNREGGGKGEGGEEGEGGNRHAVVARTLSCSSGGAPSSSGTPSSQDHPTVIQRQLSSSSGH
ncbi:uncharacterized protein LOC143295190 [Babylonia areolata]|uniref:uncharacterized protein LOC143295190 n=1 Tax=Babylonia areolata TaxID=304850 RepID=UPI003FD37183